MKKIKKKDRVKLLDYIIENDFGYEAFYLFVQYKIEQEKQLDCKDGYIIGCLVGNIDWVKKHYYSILTEGSTTHVSESNTQFFINCISIIEKYKDWFSLTEIEKVRQDMLESKMKVTVNGRDMYVDMKAYKKLSNK